MVKQIVFLVLSVMALSSCSTEQNAMQPIRISDVISSGCTSSFSAKESRPKYYESEMEKSPKMVISVDANGTGHFTVADLRGNCALNGWPCPAPSARPPACRCRFSLSAPSATIFSCLSRSAACRIRLPPFG